MTNNGLEAVNLKVQSSQRPAQFSRIEHVQELAVHSAHTQSTSVG